MKSLTTLKLTSASRSARRTSRMAASTSASVMRPRPVRRAEGPAQAVGEGVEHAGAGLLWTGIRRGAAAPGGGARVLATPRRASDAARRSVPGAAAPVTADGPRRRAPPRRRRGRTASRSPTFSPTPTKRTGTPSACSMAKTMPPLAVESSLVRTMPGQAGRLVEGLGLGEAVLAGRGVEHEEHLRLRPPAGAGR